MEHCHTCNKNLEEQCDKFSIFDLDTVTDRCFAYKIAQITGIEIPFGKCEKYICINCKCTVYLFELTCDLLS